MLYDVRSATAQGVLPRHFHCAGPACVLSICDMPAITTSPDPFMVCNFCAVPVHRVCSPLARSMSWACLAAACLGQSFVTKVSQQSSLHSLHVLFVGCVPPRDIQRAGPAWLVVRGSGVPVPASSAQGQLRGGGALGQLSQGVDRGVWKGSVDGRCGEGCGQEGLRQSVSMWGIGIRYTARVRLVAGEADTLG